MPGILEQGGGGGGAVDSVNGQTGVVVLDASDVGAQASDADLAAIAALTTATFGRSLLEAANAAGGRSLLDAAQAGAAPAAHAASHKGGGGDVIDSATSSVAGLMAAADKATVDSLPEKVAFGHVAAGSDFSNNSNPSVFQDVTGLSWGVTNGDIWSFEAFMLTQCSGVGGIIFGLNGPTASLIRCSMLGISGGVTAVRNQVFTSYDQAGVAFNQAATTDGPVWMSGLVILTATGTMAVRARPATNGQTAVVRQGAYVVARKMN